MGRLSGKSAVVSGGASGIGKAIAQLFLEEGAKVVIADINGALLDKTVTELAAHGSVLGVIGDVRAMADAARIVQRAVDGHGGLDILVCNAGITSVMPIENLAEAEWDAVLTTNVKGMFTLVKQAVPHMVARGGGKIVTLGSEMGIVAVPESPAYNASKGAVIMFTKSIALDLIRHNIRVNALCPGITRTPLLQSEIDNSLEPEKVAAAQASWAPINRVAEPREIAYGALFLASDESSFAVGSCLVLDGGFTAK
ncbi:MAG TPA: SDR family oxidoreductase [Verrucomicrobiae bacterium]|jgi:NAD(P)-dependent dehydrogenase (short-subunit alcohol dehydrogenase family)|nr:SDR family oxidoreductase [Verrucomicrobiae bacterium]